VTSSKRTQAEVWVSRSFARIAFECLGQPCPPSRISILNSSKLHFNVCSVWLWMSSCARRYRLGEINLILSTAVPCAHGEPRVNTVTPPPMAAGRIPELAVSASNAHRGYPAEAGRR
jgi:hypothetical protein